GRLNPLRPVECEVFALAGQIGCEAIRGHKVATHHPLWVDTIVFAHRTRAVGKDLRRVEVAHYVPTVRTAGGAFPRPTQTSRELRLVGEMSSFSASFFASESSRRKKVSKAWLSRSIV